MFLVSSIIAYASLCAQNKYHFVFHMLNSELSFKTETRETFVCLFIFYFLVLQSEIETFLLHFHGILWVSRLIHMAQCTDITFLVAFPSDCEFIKDKDHEELILESPKLPCCRAPSKHPIICSFYVSICKLWKWPTTIQIIIKDWK